MCEVCSSGFVGSKRSAKCCQPTECRKCSGWTTHWFFLGVQSLLGDVDGGVHERVNFKTKQSALTTAQ